MERLVAVAAVIALVVLITVDYKGTHHHPITGGVYAIVVKTNEMVYVLGWDTQTGGRVFRCRLDHGPTAVPRYELLLFREDELAPVAEVP